MDVGVSGRDGAIDADRCGVTANSRYRLVNEFFLVGRGKFGVYKFLLYLIFISIYRELQPACSWVIL